MSGQRRQYGSSAALTPEHWRLVEENLALPAKVRQKRFPRHLWLGHEQDWDDAGLEALMLAAEKFDPAKSHDGLFGPFAVCRIVWSLRTVCKKQAKKYGQLCAYGQSADRRFAMDTRRPDWWVELTDTCRCLGNHLKKLPLLWQEVIELRYFKEMTRQGIGDRYHRSRTWAYGVERVALRRLREMMVEANG